MSSRKERDAKKVGIETRQRYVLNDYLENLHVQFLSKNPAIQLSTRMLPKEIIPVYYSSRKTCICKRHQNLALKLIPFKRMKVINMANPDIFGKNYDNDEKLHAKFSQRKHIRTRIFSKSAEPSSSRSHRRSSKPTVFGKSTKRTRF